jgi:hypothetical protein
MCPAQQDFGQLLAAEAASGNALGGSRGLNDNHWLSAVVAPVAISSRLDGHTTRCGAARGRDGEPARHAAAQISLEPAGSALA